MSANRECSSLSDRKGKEFHATPEKVTKEEARLAETAVDNDRVKKPQETQAKKHSKHLIFVKETTPENAGSGTKTACSSETSNFSLVKIQIETCPQLNDDKNSKNSTANVCSAAANHDPSFKGTRFKHNQNNYNSIEPETENESTKRGSRQSAKTPAPQNGSKNVRPNSDNSTSNSKDKKPKISSKNCSAVSRSCEKSKNCEKRETLEKPNAVKKPSCSPFKKLSRSSLTIEPDKITVNLSKYSPCASRLAASSKILSSTSPTSPESPLRAVRSRSPSNFGNNRLSSSGRSRDTGIEKSTIQASLSLNIHQFQKSNSSTPRSKSVGDSCVTSPTSEGTTTSCSPTGTEILSLDEVGPTNFSPTCHAESPTGVEQLVAGDMLANSLARCAQKNRKTTLETKC